MKFIDYIMFFALISLFLTVSSCSKTEDPCKDYRIEQYQKVDCEDDCVTIITTIEYCSK